MPTDDDEFTLDNDASDFTIGAVLSQRQNGVESVVAYASRTLDLRERNYCVTREKLSVLSISFVSLKTTCSEGISKCELTTQPGRGWNTHQTLSDSKRIGQNKWKSSITS